MAQTPKNNPNELHNEQTPAVRVGVHLMFLAVKNFGLYPESNSIRKLSLENLHQWLKKFLEDNEILRLTVEKDRLMYSGDIAHQDKPDEQPLAAPLFRDSIQWFEFQDDLTLEELDKFINLICRFRVLKEEAEDDLATCLWEADLPHIKHKTADEFWEIDPMLEISSLKNIIENSDDPAAADVAAHVEAGSKTVGLVLEAFNRVDNKARPVRKSDAQADTSAGLAPGQGGVAGDQVDFNFSAPVAPAGESDQSGAGIQDQATGDFQAGEAAPGAELHHEPGLPEGVPGGVPGGSRPEGGEEADGTTAEEQAETPASGLQKMFAHTVSMLEGEETNQEITPSFSELLASLENPAGYNKRKQMLKGALSVESGQGQKLRPAGSQTYIDLSDPTGGSGHKRDSGIFDLELEDGTTTDLAMAEAMFKVSTYFDTQGTSPFWKLTPVEQRHLKSLIAMEEKRNNTGDCLGILKIMLHSLSSQEDRLGAVDFIAEEAKHALGICDVPFFHSFVEQLKREADELTAQSGDPRNWLADFLLELNKKLASEDVLSILADQPIEEKNLNDKTLGELRDFLLLLPPEAIFALTPLLPKIQSQRLEKYLLGVVAVEACYVRANISPMINNLKTSQISELLNNFKNPRLPQPTSLLVGLTRNESHYVRKEAALLLLNSNPDNIKQLFHLVDDPHLSINSMICTQMSQNRSPLPERILLDYLSDSYAQHNRGGHATKAHILNCYRALGLCGSPSTISFLQDILMRKNWKSFLGLEGNWHGVGAAMALMLMPEEWGARDILQKASQSHFRNIRLAYEGAEQELPLGWKIKDDD